MGRAKKWRMPVRMHLRSKPLQQSALVSGGLVLSASLVLGLLSLGSAAAAGPAFLGPTPDVMESPDVQGQIADELERVDTSRARLEEPAQVAVRRESRTAYTDLSDADAKALVASAFPDLISTPTWSPLAIPDGQKLVRYIGDTQALVSPDNAGSSPADDQSNQVVVGTAPLRADDEAGRLRPVDPTLVSDGDHVEPANAAVESELPRQLEDGIALPEADVSVTPTNADDAAALTVVGPDKAFYANVDTDTDFFAASTESGVETFWQLRSEASPQELRLRLDIPPGAGLDSSFHGLGARIETQTGDTVATIDPPQALDADGTPVDVELEPHGDELILRVPHRTSDVHYPLIVDPTINVQYWWEYNDACPAASASSYPGWRWEGSPNGPPFYPGCDSSSGLVTWTPGGGWAGTNWYAQWVWAPPPNTYLSQVQFTNSDLRVSAPDLTCSYRGIYSQASVAWETGGPYCSQYTWNINTYYGNLDNDVAVYQLFSPNGNPHNQAAWTALRDAQFWVGDKHPPSVGPAATPDSAWIDDSTAGGGLTAYNYTASASDLGLGIKSITLSDPWGTETHSHSCNDVRWNPCPTSWSSSFSYDLPEGQDLVSIAATDLAGNPSPAVTWTQQIDRSPPVVLPPGGTLYSDRTNVLPGVSYSLDLSATDGSTANDASKRSGVKSMQVYVDGSLAYTTSDHSCAAGNSCPANPSLWSDARWSIPPNYFSTGTHTIRIAAADQVNHTTTVAQSQSFNITVADEETEPAVAFSAGPVGGDGYYDLTVTASDGQPAGSGAATQSGVQDLDVYAGDQVLDSVHQSCPQGGCGYTRVYHLNSATYSPTTTEFFADAGDGDENESTEFFGAKKSRFQYFGYSDDPTPLKNKFDAATDGGARIIRIGLNWCGIGYNEEHPETPSDESKWSQRLSNSAYEPVFADVRGWNNAHPADQVAVIAILYDAPPWSFDGHDDVAGCADRAVMPPDAGFDGSFGDFATAVSDTWGGDPTNGLVAVEAWNEPNLPNYWGVPTVDANGNPISPKPAFTPEPHRFAGMVNAVNSSIETWNAAGDHATTRGGLGPVRVISAGLSPDGGSFSPDAVPDVYLDNAMDPTGGNSMAFDDDNPSTPPASGLIDGLGVHLYATRATRDNQAARSINDQYNGQRATLIQNGSNNVPIWITEVGFPSATGGSRDLPPQAASRKHQCLRITAAYSHFVRRGGKPTAFIIDRLVDPPDGSEQNRFGVTRLTDESTPTSDLDKKESYRELRKLTDSDAMHKPINCKP